ncbi:MAG: glycosyltransferase family 9 protein [Alphaproteobacteria bacterium]
MNEDPASRILLIKLGALGDFILSFAAFSAIRRHHPRARITLLTVPEFAEIAKKSRWFDEIWTEGSPQWWRLGDLLRLVRRLRQTGFHRVYDLEGTGRTSRYRGLVTMFRANAAEWVGAGSTAPQHIVERQLEQLGQAGIANCPPPDLSWLTSGFPGRFGLKDGFILMAPGAAGDKAGEHWPTKRYSELARRVAIEGRRPVLIGGKSEAPSNRLIAAATPEAMDLTGKLSLFDVAALATRASVAVGDDTGSMHLIAASGCPSVVMFSHASDPARTAPRGRYVVIVREQNLADLPLSEVAAAMRLR